MVRAVCGSVGRLDFGGQAFIGSCRLLGSTMSEALCLPRSTEVIVVVPDIKSLEVIRQSVAGK